MRREPSGEIIYAVGDRVVVSIDGDHVRGRVCFPRGEISVFVSIREFGLGQWHSTIGYKIRLDDGRKIEVSEVAIVKQCDTGGLGRIEHLEVF